MNRYLMRFGYISKSQTYLYDIGILCTNMQNVSSISVKIGETMKRPIAELSLVTQVNIHGMQAAMKMR